MKNLTSKQQSLEDCRRKCANQWGCKAVNYNSKDSTCELFSYHGKARAGLPDGWVSALPECFSKPDIQMCELAGLHTFNHLVGFEPLVQTLEDVRVFKDAANTTTKTFSFYSNQYWKEEGVVKGLISDSMKVFPECEWAYKREDNKECPDEFN
eukprot:gb/GFBE01060527.1/.p1 GENE.gb/GFBE01060527.1/~~gb/GFBE01060527.1/.p1  ORF type:complete len:153 (+),score=41.81 gb/GFBE01060527.1/:1-459(+)